MKFAVCVDFGSTYTKVVCVDLQKRKVVATDKFPSTVHEDASIGLNQCFDVAKRTIGEEAFTSALKLATSSAAGGLRMAVIGLTESLSNKAGRHASFSAGAKIVYNTAGLLTEEALREIEQSTAEILLLCGGYEKGNTKAMLHNIQKLSESNVNIPIIYAGNSMISKDVRLMLGSKGKECFLAENIIPEIGKLNTEPTAEIVRNLFMSRITNMKGVGQVQEWMDGPIVPTPAAVLAAGELLSRGTKTTKGLGNLMMVDVGGATTDIYSYIENMSYKGAKCIGAVEPFAKRTVEGDMGMRESSICLVKEFGEKAFAEESGVSAEVLDKAIEKRLDNTAYLAEDAVEKRIDDQIASAAVGISARRHAGWTERALVKGTNLIQYGKNLTEIKTVIGIGGIIVNNEKPASILEHVKAESKEEGTVLLPSEINAFVDQDYVFFAAGLLSGYDEEAALAIMKTSLRI